MWPTLLSQALLSPGVKRLVRSIARRVVVRCLGAHPGSQGPLLPKKRLCGLGDLVGTNEMPREHVSEGEAFLPPSPCS